MPRTKKTTSYEISKLGRHLMELRKEMNLSLRQVARECRVAVSWLSKFEQGNVFKSMNIETLVRLSQFYKIPVCAMLKEAGFTQHEHEDGELPGLFEYFRRKFRLAPQAIRDIETVKTLMEEKYKKK